jgi:hypothetical protein
MLYLGVISLKKRKVTAHITYSNFTKETPEKILKAFVQTAQKRVMAEVASAQAAKTVKAE